jgi:hypothetical protein
MIVAWLNRHLVGYRALGIAGRDKARVLGLRWIWVGGRLLGRRFCTQCRGRGEVPSDCPWSCLRYMRAKEDRGR